MHAWLLAGTSFVASAVEAVEALTIVLAVGIARTWRVALAGAATALVVLAILAFVFGPLIGTRIPLVALRVAAGTVAIVLGAGWLRKAVLRAAGRKAQHDEAVIYERERALLNQEHIGGFLTAFNGVFVEGLEVVVIVISLGAATVGGLGPAVLGALVALALVGLAGIALHRPLARVPENAMKWSVSVMLLAFGTFWLGESAGVAWPFGDAMLPVLAASIGIASVVTVLMLRRPPTSA
jgi:Ca2+/H+ antiporter, TMEM165/GDT1 family